MDAFDLIQQGKITRYFRSTQKLNIPNLVSHITQRAAGKDLLFLEDNDYLFMLGSNQISYNCKLSCILR